MRASTSLVVGLLLVCACSADKQSEWLIVSRDTLIVGVEITGALKAKDSTSVGAPALQNVWVDYKIASLAPEGEVVKEGDMVVSFDASSLKEQLMARENSRDSTMVFLEKRRHEIDLAMRDEALRFEEAQAAVRKATLAADQSSDLTGSLIIKKAQLDLDAAIQNVEHMQSQIRRKKANNRSEVATLQGRVDLANREVEELNKNIANMTVTAKRAGTVIYGTKWGDEKFKVGDSIWRGNSVLEIASVDSMMAEGTIDEADSAKLVVGQQVRLRLEAHPDSEVRGTLNYIARTVQRKSRDIPTQVVAVKLSIEHVDELQLRPGMRFRGEVETERIDNAIIVPITAVFGSAGGPVAYRKSGGDSERVRLVLGKRGKRGVQVLEGLGSGDKVSRFDLSRARR